MRLLDELRDHVDRLLGRDAARDLSAPELRFVAVRESGLDLVQHRRLQVAGQA